ncbi:MAG: S41 family peptidase [Vallitaleaceae bacterium]|nr:S41 family peptidase [Vallitaleaceae bacterium]
MSNKFKIWLPLLFSVAIAIGIFIGNMLAERDNSNANNAIFNTFFTGSSKLQTVIDLIDSEYVEDINTDSITEELMPKILAKLDPHSVYIPAKDLQTANEGLEGSFSGIGVQFNIQNDTVMVVAVINGGPSEKLGILAGDRIVTVDDSLFVGDSITNEKVVRRLRGEKGTKVKLGIKRRSAKKLIYYTVTRNDVPVKSVDVSYMLTPTIGYVKVSSFGAVTFEEFQDALAKLNHLGAQKYVIDLRGNSGGFLDAAINLVNEFLVKGSLIVYTKGKAYPRKDAYANGKGSFQESQLVVLIDEWSASASEIFAGAMQDNDRALIIGRRSFGKGLVQQQIPFNDGSAVRLTIARYYTPSGRCIQTPYKKGDSEAYEMDIVNRYLHGEMSSKDSIRMPDSLKFKTLIRGRTVYGNGGIVPDVFVPRDTLGYTPYYNRVMNMGLAYEFAFQYVDDHRAKLERFKDWELLLSYLQDQNILEKFVEFSEDNGVRRRSRHINKSKMLLQKMLFAYISRDVMGNDAFYPILNDGDNCVDAAVGQLSNKRLLK